MKTLRDWIDSNRVGGRFNLNLALHGLWWKFRHRFWPEPWMEWTCRHCMARWRQRGGSSWMVCNACFRDTQIEPLPFDIWNEPDRAFHENENRPVR